MIDGGRIVRTNNEVELITQACSWNHHHHHHCLAHQPNQSSSMTMNQEKSFHLFVYLNEDIKSTVLSFLADAPFEFTQEVGCASSLTHNLPRVSQKFRVLASSDLLWKDAVVRQTKKEPFLWKPALDKMATRIHDEEEKVSTPQELVEEAYKSNNYSSYKVLYQNIVTNHLRYKGPVFHMEGQGMCMFVAIHDDMVMVLVRVLFLLLPHGCFSLTRNMMMRYVCIGLRFSITTVCLGEPYSLHFFEPRYRRLIADILCDYPDEARHGGHIRDPPYFLHANRGPLAPTTPATLVQVVRCEMFADGRADVILMPTAVREK